MEVNNYLESIKTYEAAGRDFCLSSNIENEIGQDECSCLSEVSIWCNGTPQLTNLDKGIA